MNSSRYVVVALIYLVGILGIGYWRKKQKDHAYFFYLITWSMVTLVGYVFYLSVRYQSVLIAFPLFFMGIFLFSYFKEKRRLINGLLFNLFIGSWGIYLIILMIKSEDIFLGGILALIGVPLVMLPFVGIYALILFLYWNGIVVLRKEAHSLANLLTLLLAIFLTFVLLFNLFVVQYLPDWVVILCSTLPMILVYLLFVLYNFLTVSVLYQFNRPRYHQDYIVVLGAGLIDGERVTPLLAKRIDKAIAFYKAQRRATMKIPKLVMSGGQGSDEKIPESIAMKNYALEQGIPDEDILVEANSTTTLENMRFSKEIMDGGQEQPYKAIFTSNNYHIFRAGLYAKKAQLKADGLGAQTAFYYLPNAFLREFIAIVMMNKKRHSVMAILIIGVMVLFSIIQFLYG